MTFKELEHWEEKMLLKEMAERLAKMSREQRLRYMEKMMKEEMEHDMIMDMLKDD